jgi:quercetin dioxygenase-like cupin family protein
MKAVNWKNIPVEQVNPHMKRQFIYGEKIMISRLQLADGFEVPWHSHENEQITECIEGKMRFWFDNNEKDHMDLLPGDSLIIPGNRPHKARMIGNVVETDTFSPPRKDWIDKSDSYLRK